MTTPNGGDTPQERIARLEASQATLTREVSELAGNVDRFVSSTQAGFERLSTAIAQVERNVGGEIARINRPDWPRIGVMFAIVMAVLTAVMAPVLVRQSWQETWSRSIDDRVQRDHERLAEVRIEVAVLEDRFERNGSK